MNENPIFTGMGGQVWEVAEALRLIRERNPGKPDATVGMWLVNCPQAHPLWSHYLMILIHLRPVEGITGLKIYLEGASHETWLYAMHPDWKPSLSDIKIFAHRLTPSNFAAQFRASSDEEARRFCLRALNDVAEGVLSPDTDFMREWARRFGDNMIKKEFK